MKPIVDLAGNVFLPEGDIVITTGPLVGLGDHAIYSTLAKRFAELGRDVYLDEEIVARNDDILALFWKNNPYIKALSDKKPNAGYIRQGLFYEIANRFPLGSMEAMERAHGLPPPYSLAPWASYEPKPFHLDLSRTILVDFSSVSSTIEDTGIAEFLRAMKSRFRNAPFVQIIPPKFASLHPPRIGVESIQIDNAFQYIDAVKSARAWIGSEAGGQSLAAIARGDRDVYEISVYPEIVVCTTPKTLNSRGYTYRCSDYRCTQFGGDKTGDYFFPLESQVHQYNMQCFVSHDVMRSIK
jgi:hypothetical protein